MHKHSQYTNPSLLARNKLSVRLLVPRACAWATKFLRLAPTIVCNKKGAIVCDKSLLQLILAVLIDVFLVVGNLQRDKSMCHTIKKCVSCREERTILFAIACRIA